MLSDHHGETYQPEHVRQLMAYVSNLQRQHPGSQVAGLLLYAQGQDAVDDPPFEVWGAKVQVATLDLAAHWTQVEAQLRVHVGADWLAASPEDAALADSPASEKVSTSAHV